MRQFSRIHFEEYQKLTKQAEENYRHYEKYKEAEDKFKIGNNIIFIENKQKAKIISGWNGCIDFAIEYENGSTRGMTFACYKDEWEYTD